jgi:hypothetical protein
MSSKDWIGYKALVDKAFRGVIRDALQHAARGGTMGNHHFFVTFDTRAPGIQLSETMRERHPGDLTIVIQHQYWNLKVEEDAFEVGLSFNKVPEMIRVPFAAVRQFADPSQNFGFQCQTDTPPAGADVQTRQVPVPPPPPPKSEEPDEQGPSDPTVVSLDKFRKK